MFLFECAGYFECYYVGTGAATTCATQPLLARSGFSHGMGNKKNTNIAAPQCRKLGGRIMKLALTDSRGICTELTWQGEYVQW